MHADIGMTIVFRNVEKKENYKLDWLKKTVKSLIQSKSMEAGKSVHVEYIIELVINVFKDYKGINSMAINMGYNYYYDSKDAKVQDDIIYSVNKKIILNMTILIKNEYEGKFYCLGICPGSTYVANSKLKEHGIGSLYFGKPNDKWFEYFWKPMDSSIVYSIFPKEKITLPKSPPRLEKN